MPEIQNEENKTIKSLINIIHIARMNEIWSGCIRSITFSFKFFFFHQYRYSLLEYFFSFRLPWTELFGPLHLDLYVESSTNSPLATNCDCLQKWLARVYLVKKALCICNRIWTWYWCTKRQIIIMTLLLLLLLILF